MPKTLVCKVTWSVSKPLEMVSIAKFSVKKMTANSSTPNPKVPLSDMTTAAELVEDLYPTREGTDEEKAAYKAALTDLNSKLDTQTLYVDEQANGSEKIILSCGFTPTSDDRNAAVLPLQIEVVKLKAVAGGSFKALIKKPKGTTGLFIVIFTGDVVPLKLVGNQIIVPDGATGIIMVPRGLSTNLFHGFSDFSKVSVVVYGTNAAGIGPVSGVFSTKLL